jgi:hypothetical protein
VEVQLVELKLSYSDKELVTRLGSHHHTSTKLLKKKHPEVMTEKCYKGQNLVSFSFPSFIANNKIQS